MCIVNPEAIKKLKRNINDTLKEDLKWNHVKCKCKNREGREKEKKKKRSAKNKRL